MGGACVQALNPDAALSRALWQEGARNIFKRLLNRGVPGITFQPKHDLEK